MSNSIFSLLSGVLDENLILCDEPMKKHTSFKIGGNADFMVLPENMKQIKDIVSTLKENSVLYTVIGNGSNLLVDDNGIRGVVIKIAKNFSNVVVSGETIIARSGVLLSRLANVALDNSLTGFEFAAGIPGTLGGAVVMNAGAYGGEMKDVIAETTYMDADGEIKTIRGEQHCFGYRKSVFCKDDIILESTLILKKGDKDAIGSKMSELNAQRREKQPLEFPSAGSAFKRPDGYFAGKLIQDAGLKGYQIGGAMVSPKHSGFIVSDGTATCADVLALIEHVQNEVYKQFEVKLEPEVRYIK